MVSRLCCQCVVGIEALVVLLPNIFASRRMSASLTRALTVNYLSDEFYDRNPCFQILNRSFWIVLCLN